MIKYLTMTIEKQKNIALIAHDGKNGNMQLCSWKCDVYSVKIDFKERDADC